MPFIRIEDHIVNFRLRRSHRVKRLQMAVREHLFEVIAPARVSNHEVLLFIRQYQGWMVKQLKTKIKTLSHPIVSWPPEFLAGETIPYRASSLKLNMKFGASAQVCLQEDILTVTLRHKTLCSAVVKSARQQVLTWYHQQAQEAILCSIEALSSKLGRWPNGFGLKQQKTRWGSCGISQKIYINWLLILAPYGVLEYVVAHELCHLFHRNHSKRFWAKVETCFPQYQQHESWLREHGHTLMGMAFRHSLKNK